MQYFARWFLLIGMLISHSLYALPILEKIEEIKMASGLSEKQRKEGENILKGVLIQCEFDEICIIRQIGVLKAELATNHNPMILSFLEYILYNQKKLERDGEQCRSDQKREMRQAYAKCIHEKVQSEKTMVDMSSRSKIDKLDDIYDVCLKSSMEKLAESGNIFAQAIMVNLSQQMSDEAKIDYWYGKIQKNNQSEEFKMFMRCPEIP